VDTRGEKVQMGRMDDEFSRVSRESGNDKVLRGK